MSNKLVLTPVLDFWQFTNVVKSDKNIAMLRTQDNKIMGMIPANDWHKQMGELKFLKQLTVDNEVKLPTCNTQFNCE